RGRFPDQQAELHRPKAAPGRPEAEPGACGPRHHLRPERSLPRAEAPGWPGGLDVAGVRKQLGGQAHLYYLAVQRLLQRGECAAHLRRPQPLARRRHIGWQ
ncbi:unnamed protein product, partial [Effrenium voratum]